QARAAAEQNGAQSFKSLDAALAAAPTAVLVCTPPTLHVEVASRALDAGAHIFIEKPISHELSESLDRLLNSAERAGLVVMVGYNLRFHPGLLKLRSLVTAGVAGELLTLRAEYGQYLPTWRPGADYRSGYFACESTGGGILLEESHEFDYVAWLGGEVRSVFARAGRLSELEIETEDTALAILELPGGRLAEIHVDCVQRGYARSCKYVGAEATLFWDYTSGVTVTRDGRDDEVFEITPDPNEMYLSEIAHFVECVNGRATPPVDGPAARRVLEVVLAAKRSARERREISLT
ncbi:MAG: Gfo/Idh/MocA family oxidoreductase, partial [Chloroflexi bacterium]|nr:Gfo/Idh/MocA family oxidoreductase [Chloroflexota bacterium]